MGSKKLILSIKWPMCAYFIHPVWSDSMDRKVFACKNLKLDDEVVWQLDKLHRLEVLDLSFNMITLDIPVRLPFSKNLYTIILKNNQISDKGAVKLAEAIGLCKNLQELDLGINYIEDEGASNLADALGTCRFLTSLDMSHNQIGEAGFDALVEHLSRTEIPLSVAFHGNEHGDDVDENLLKVRS